MATRAASRTWVSVIESPCSITHDRATKYSGVTPVICVLQFWAAKITWVLPVATGAETRMAGNFAIASASFSVTLGDVPTPERNPPADVEPDKTINKLLPMEVTARLTPCLAPSPTASINTTADTPMIMPNMVSAVRSRFAPNARHASPSVATGFIALAPARHARPGRP